MLALGAAFGIGAHRQFNAGDHRLNLAMGFPQGFAGIERDQPGEGVAVIADFIAKAADQFDAGGQGPCGPFRPGCLRLCHGVIDIA